MTGMIVEWDELVGPRDEARHERCVAYGVWLMVVRVGHVSRRRHSLGGGYRIVVNAEIISLNSMHEQQ